MQQNILLFTQNIERAKQEIGSVGGRITQQFTETVFVANLPDSVAPDSLQDSSPQQPTALDQASQLSVDAWKNLQNKTTSRALDGTEGLSWDTPGFTPPQFIDRDGPGNAPTPRGEDIQQSTGTPTSLYLTGSVAVGVIIVSGQGDLAFSADEQLKVIQEVQEGLTFLADAEPKAQLSFVYDIRVINVSVAAGPTTSYESAEGPWRNAALQVMGYPPQRESSIQYVQDLRQSRGTNWAYVGYFTKYPLHHFAYAVTEKTVMHYGNDGWGVDNINKVFAHESCHIFGAADEYGSCTCGGSHGYLGAPNNNCVNCAGAHESCLMEGNVLQLCKWSRRQLGWDDSLFPSVFPPLSPGTYTIKQKSSGRFVDAHEIAQKDFSLVTRPGQNNNTQRWTLVPVGTVYTMQQKLNSRFLDAHEIQQKDFSAVTRTVQNDDTQRWVFMHQPGALSTYTIQQLSNGKFLDAHEDSGNDFNVVTRPAQNNSSQRWQLGALGNNTYTIRHQVNGRFLDAHEDSAKDFSAVTRTAQSNDSQRWILKPVGGVYTIRQLSNGRFVDAHETAANDFSVVTRIGQANSTQRWVIMALGNNTFTIQQSSNGRFMDAHESAGNDFNVVTRPAQNNDTQRWVIKGV